MLSWPVSSLKNPHLHWREGAVMQPLVRLSLQGGARMFGPMPNTKAGLMTGESVVAYTSYANEVIPPHMATKTIGIVQITAQTTRADIDACVAMGVLDAKIYPKGRTTKSHNGVAHYGKIIDLVRYAGERGMRIHLHPEHPSELYDNRDAEFAFLPIVDILMHETNAIIIWEHGTDARCIPHWVAWAKTGRFFVTITAHHLLENESTSFGDTATACKPPVKREADRAGLLDLIYMMYDWVMAGGDDAPHPIEDKHRVGPCACGAYTAPFLLALYAHAILGRQNGPWALEKFISTNAEKLYGKLEDKEKFVIKEEPFTIPLMYEAGPWKIEPFWAGRTINYTLVVS